MAGTRGAAPTLTGVTDDASRGGLFVQSNVANPVSGADVQGTIINDSTITLTITINGDPVTRTFTTNQAADSTLAFDFTVAGTGGDGSDDGVVTGGRYDPASQTIILNRSNGLPDAIVTGVTFTPRTDTEIETIANTQIGLADIQDLSNVPAPTAGTTDGQLLAWNNDSTAITYVPVPDANVATNSFSSTDNTVEITAGTGANVGRVNLEAQPAWIGNANNAPTGSTIIDGNTTVQISSLTLGADTGLVLVDNGSGAYSIQMQGPAPANAVAPTIAAPPASNAFTTPPDQVITITPQGTDTITGLDITSSGLGVIDPAGDLVTSATTMVSPTMATITIPGTDARAPGDYRVTSETTTMSTDGETTMTRTTETIDRYIPFVQSRTDITVASQIENAVSPAASTMDFNRVTGITAITGSGVLYFAVIDGSAGLPNTITRATDQGNTFRVRVGFLRSISVALADGTSRLYNIFRAPVNGGSRIAEFT